MANFDVYVSEDDEESDGDFDGDDINVAEEALIFNYDDNNSLGGTALIQKTVELVSAHKMTIAEMVEVSSCSAVSSNEISK